MTSTTANYNDAVRVLSSVLIIAQSGTCFDIAFGKLGVIPRTRNKFVEIVAVAECYLITNLEKRIKEAAVPNIPSCKIS